MNDYSNDTSLEKLKNLSISDNRIKIINNDKNHGLLYSRAMGILYSSGEYLMNLDVDDELAGEDSLEYLYNLTQKNIDIVNFAILEKISNKTINKCTYILKKEKQPEIFNSIFDSKNIISDFYVWNKLIKREIFLKAYQSFKDAIYNANWNYFEDDIWSILVNRYAKTKICTDKLVYIYNYNNDSLMNKRHGLIEFQNLLYRHNMYRKIFKSKEEQKFLIAEYFFIFNRLKGQKKYILLLNNTGIKSQIIDTFIILLNNYNCSIQQKRNIINFLGEIKI